MPFFPRFDVTPTASIAKMFVALILGCRATKTKKLMVNLHCSVVTSEHEGTFTTVPITSFLNKADQNETGLTDMGTQRFLIDEVIQQKRWTRKRRPEGTNR
eukprot:GHVT01015196.1.p2 GENE.GHVT01015196.1~~GHVT01015196.1.p2  ORF type:complete len:101 (+),score=5.92 GHVT01015196.1:1488-1790(+)